MSSEQDELCSLLANAAMITSLSFILLTLILSYLFWKHHNTPAFKSRRPIITLFASICIVASLIFPVCASYNVCHQGSFQETLYFNVTSAALLTYGLCLITYRTWILFINWKMAIMQLSVLEKPTGSIENKQNIWWTIHRYFATKNAIKCWCILLSFWSVLDIPAANTTIYLHEKQIGSWILRMRVMFWCLISVILVISARNMRDHFSLMTEMKLYIVINIIVLMVFIVINYKLQQFAPNYTFIQLQQIKSILCVIRSGVASILLLSFPLFKFRYSVHGILLHTNLMHTRMSTQEQNLAELVEIDADFKTNTEEIINAMFLNVDKAKYPSLLLFLSKNSKCYEAFKKHLAACLAVENLLFFIKAQKFRLCLKMANDAKIALETNKNDTVKGQHDSECSTYDPRYYVLRLDFFYLHGFGGVEFDGVSIKEQWMNIYDNFISSLSPYQINVDYEMVVNIERFKTKMESDDANISVNDYIQCFEDAMMEIWILMDGLYLHFQVSEGYKQLIEENFPQYFKNDNEQGPVGLTQLRDASTVESNSV